MFNYFRPKNSPPFVVTPTAFAQAQLKANANRNNQIFSSKIKKQPTQGVPHSFIDVSGSLFALDNKQRHRMGDPTANGLIGQGDMGKIKRCLSADGTVHALKIIPRDTFSDEKQRHTWSALTKMGQFVGGFNLPNKTYTVMKYISGQNVLSYLSKQGYYFPFNDSALYPFVLKLSYAVKYAHDKNIVHLDIKVDNMMISSEEGNKIRLIDFDAAIDLSLSTAEEVGVHITNDYSPMEARGDNAASPAKSMDIYMLGGVFKKVSKSFYSVSEGFLALESRMKNNANPAARPPIESVITELRTLREQSERIALRNQMAGVVLLPMLFFAANIIVAWTAIQFSMVGLLLSVGQKLRSTLEKDSFSAVVASHDEPLELSSAVLSQLKNNVQAFEAFREGYLVSQSTGTDYCLKQAKTRFTLKNYSTAYYAGSRWQKLHPQDEAITDPVPANTVNLVLT